MRTLWRRRACSRRCDLIRRDQKRRSAPCCLRDRCGAAGERKAAGNLAFQDADTFRSWSFVQGPDVQWTGQNAKRRLSIISPLAIVQTSRAFMTTQPSHGDERVVLHAENLGRSVPAKILIADANFELYGAETLAIVGPSGSGKTSLLRLLNRLDEPTNGTVYLDGSDYRQIAPRDLRRRVGMVMQRPYLFPGTVADNLRFGPRQRGEELSDARIEELLAAVGLAG